MSGIKHQRGGERSDERCDDDRRGNAQHRSPPAWTEQALLSFAFCAGAAPPPLKDLIPMQQLNTNQEKTRGGGGGGSWLSWKHRLSWWHCPHCDRRFLCNDRWNEKQPILILHQSAIIYEPGAPPSPLIPLIRFPIFFYFAATILGRQTSASVSRSLKEKPQHKLWEVVYSEQAAPSWGSGVPESLANAVGD